MAFETRETIIIRKAVAADLESLNAFITPFVQSGKLLPRTTDELQSLLPSCFIAEKDGEIVGCAALEIYSKKLAELRSLAVANEAQRRGIGRSLVQACVQFAREQSILEVMAITSTEEFFQRCGFDFTLPGEKKALFIRTRES
jgi:N-acetylglutamate synthase-like GNAT family acetyltransferase